MCQHRRLCERGEDPPKTGNRSLYFSPSGVYPTGDGAVVITCPSQKFFRNLCDALDLDLADDPRFASVEARQQNEEELDRPDRGAACRAFSQDELVERLVAADVLTAPINDIPEVVIDPQIVHNEMIVETEHATGARSA